LLKYHCWFHGVKTGVFADAKVCV